MFPAALVLTLALLVVYSGLMLFYYRGWKKTAVFYDAGQAKTTKVSIVIAARNEASNIGNCLAAIFRQEYSKELYEVIVVDDHSEDNTLQVAERFEAANLKILSLKTQRKDNTAFKKQAIELGIRHSTGTLIITTDADCVMGEKWLSTIVGYYEKYRPKVIAGPVMFQHEKSWLEKWQSLDLVGLMGITAGAITNGFPNMCNGANLAYEREAFEAVDGFAGIDNLPTGDDILLLLKMEAKYPGQVQFLKATEAIVKTSAQPTFRDLVMQRMRWLSKSTSFQDIKISWVLVGAYLFNLSLLVNSLLGLIVGPSYLMLAGVAFGLKVLVELPLMISAARFFKKSFLLIYFLPAQVLHIIYVIGLGILSKVLPYSWKGREYEPGGQQKVVSVR